MIVVLPAFDEEAGLGALLERIDQVLSDHALRYEVIVVDDGSRDGTLAVAREHAAHMPLRVVRHEVNQGLGASLRDGLAAAAACCGDADLVVAMDADDTHDPGLIPALARALEEGADVAIASRYRPGAQVRGVPLHREWLSLAASWLLRLVFPIRGVRDYTCGYRAYRGRLLREAFRRFGADFVAEAGFQCSVDVLLKLHALGAVFRELPLILRYDRKAGASKMRVGSTVLDTFRLVLRRRFRPESR